MQADVAYPVIISKTAALHLAACLPPVPPEPPTLCCSITALNKITVCRWSCIHPELIFGKSLENGPVDCPLVVGRREYLPFMKFMKGHNFFKKRKKVERCHAFSLNSVEFVHHPTEWPNSSLNRSICRMISELCIAINPLASMWDVFALCAHALLCCRNASKRLVGRWLEV